MPLSLLNEGSKIATGNSLLQNFSDLNPFSTSEPGSGLTQANTLEHSIDKLDRANDFEAIKTADLVRGEISRGVFDKSKLFRVIEKKLNYKAGAVESSRKANYISNMLDEEIQAGENRQVERERRNLSGPVMAGFSGSLPSFSGMQWAFFAIIGGGLFYAVRSGKK